MVKKEMQMADIKHEIVSSVGTVSMEQTGWKKELNVVKWNGVKAKYDLRRWSSDHKKLGHGVTLTEDELVALGKLINKELARIGRGVV